VELVVNLPILNAPFRLYWSYNYRPYFAADCRADQRIQHSQQREAALPFDAFQTQISISKLK